MKEEKDNAFKAKIMLRLQEKEFQSAKPERFGAEYNYAAASKDFENGDDFVAYLGFLGDSAQRFS